MIGKIRRVIKAFHNRLGSRKQEISKIALHDDPQAREQEKSDADKIEKAILLFKQKRRNGKRAEPIISSENEFEETSSLARDDISEVISGTSLQNSCEVVREEPAISSQNDPKEALGLLQDDISGVIHATPMQNGAEEMQEEPETSLQNNADEVCDIRPQNHSGEKEKEKAGWVSPTYCQCRTTQLNPGVIAENRCLAFLDNAPEAEAYRVLRTQILQRTKVAGSNTIMITSALPGEGKTLAAINLAFTLAREFQHTVLLVDGDLRKQNIYKYLGCEGERGLVDYLVDGAPISELITWPGIEKMTFISGGRPFQESAEILGSPRMKGLVSDIKGRYPDRYIIFDMPSVLGGADALTFAPLVDQVIMIVQAGKTSMDDVKKALQLLPKEKILGFVINRCLAQK